MAIGFALRALARRRFRAAPPVTVTGGVLDFSSPQAGALLAIIAEDF